MCKILKFFKELNTVLGTEDTKTQGMLTVT